MIDQAQGDVAMLRAEGASMEPTISDGDELIIDFHPTTQPRPGIYVIQVDNQLSVKDIEMLPGGTLMVRSRNPAYPDQTFTTASENDIRILGRASLQKKL